MFYNIKYKKNDVLICTVLKYLLYLPSVFNLFTTKTEKLKTEKQQIP